MDGRRVHPGLAGPRYEDDGPAHSPHTALAAADGSASLYAQRKVQWWYILPVVFAPTAHMLVGAIYRYPARRKLLIGAAVVATISAVGQRVFLMDHAGYAGGGFVTKSDKHYVPPEDAYTRVGPGHSPLSHRLLAWAGWEVGRFSPSSASRAAAMAAAEEAAAEGEREVGGGEPYKLPEHKPLPQHA
jgi:hypothetical protein